MKLSVLVMTYNHREYISEALDGILMQKTDFDFEILIGEDDSDDGTREICREYAAKYPDRIRLFLNDRKNVIYIDGKPTGRWNFINLFKHARGKYIAWCEGDDYWTDPYKLQKQVDFLDQKPDFVICFHHVDWLINGQLKRNTYLPPTSKGYYTADDLFMHDNFMRTCSVVFRNGLFDELPEWFYHIPYGDIAMHVLNAQHGKIGYIDETMGVYRVHSGGIYSNENPFFNIIRSIKTFSTLAEQLNYKDSDSYKIGMAKIHYWMSSEAKRVAEQFRQTISPKGIAIWKSFSLKSQNHPLFSVIIPTYNRPDMLVQAVKSVLDQTFQDFEIIVVNDGGEDVSERISSLDSGRKIRYLSHSKNKGLAAARNTGIRNARGKYIALLDDDDIFYPNHLETALAYLNENRPVIYTDAVRASFQKVGDGYALIDKTIPYSIDFERNKLLLGNIAPVNCFVFERELAMKAGLFDESFTTLEDWEFWIRLSSLTHFQHVPVATVQVNWRTDGTTMTSSRQKEFGINRKRIYQRYSHEIAKISNKNEILAEFNAIWQSDVRKKNLVSIVILTFNQLKYTRECVESIRKHTPEPHEIIFVDNGSKDGTVKWLRRLVKDNPNYKLIENRENVGFARGCNQGIEASSGEYILLLNNDVVVTEDWLAGMLECLNSSPDIGIVGPMTNNISGPQKVDSVSYSSMNEMEAYARGFREKYRYRRVPSRRIVGFCMLFRQELVNRIGVLDESFGSGNFEDDDYCLRAAMEGYRNVIAADVFIHHYGSRSFKGNNIDYASAMAKNRKIFVDKWSSMAPESPQGRKLLAVNVIEKADVLAQKGQLEMAVDVILEGIRHSPEHKPLYYRLVEILIDNRKFLDALEALESMPVKDDNDPTRYELAGLCREGMDELNEADEYADRALSLNSGSVKALNLKGLVTLKRGNPDEAEKYFEKAIESDSGYGEPYNNIGAIRWSQGRLDEAFKLFERAFILSPTSPDIAANFHAALAELSRAEEAEVTVRDSLNLHPMSRSITYLLIDILLRQEKFDQAMEVIEQAIITFGPDDEMLATAKEIRDIVGPLDRTADRGTRGTISMCMIARDEEKHIARCLNSIKSVVDEMIVVDTGSTDRTRDIAAAFGAKVYDFEWKDDFATARNFSLSKASGDWILVLDADEAISSLDHDRLRKLTGRRNRKPVAYSIVTRNYVVPVNKPGWVANDGTYAPEEAGTGWIPSEKVRLFPNMPDIRFENPVHELVEPSLQRKRIPVRKCDIPVHHYGKLNEKKITDKGEEYYKLGKKKLAEKGDRDLKALFELAVQAGELSRFDEAVKYWHDVIAIRPDMPRAYLNLGFALMQLGRFNEALTASRKALELDPESKDTITNHAVVELCAGDAKSVIASLHALREREPAYPMVYAGLGAAYCCEGDMTKGMEYLGTLKKMNFRCANFLCDLAKKLTSAGRLKAAINILEAAMATHNINAEIPVLLARCYRSQVEQSAGADAPVQSGSG